MMLPSWSLKIAAATAKFGRIATSKFALSEPLGGRGDFSLSSNIGFQCREDVLQSGGLIELNCFMNKIVPNKPNLV
jgi:hypothetical protein